MLQKEGDAQLKWSCHQVEPSTHGSAVSGTWKSYQEGRRFLTIFHRSGLQRAISRSNWANAKEPLSPTRADVALSAVASCYETRGVECTIQLSGDFTVKTDTKSRNPHLSIPFVCHVIIIILRAYYKRWWWWCVCECGWSIQSFPPAGGNGGRSGGAVMSDVISIFLSISNACAKTRHYCCNSAPSTTFPDISRHIGE